MSNENRQFNLIKSKVNQAYKQIDTALDYNGFDDIEHGVALGLDKLLKIEKQIETILKSNEKKGNQKMSNEFLIEIKEVLSRTVKVEAETMSKALQIASEKYRKEEIVLDDSDYSGIPTIRSVKKKGNYEVSIISRKEYHTLLEKHFNKEDIGNEQYILKSNDVYIAVDNSTQDFWTEEFNTLEEALKYLDGAYTIN